MNKLANQMAFKWKELSYGQVLTSSANFIPFDFTKMKSSFVISAAVNPTNHLKKSNVKWLQIFLMVSAPLNSKEGREQCRDGSSQDGKCKWMVGFVFVYGWLMFSKYLQGSYNV